MLRLTPFVRLQGSPPIYRFRESINVKVLVDDRDAPIIRLTPIVSESVDYVLLSDKALTELGIVIIDATMAFGALGMS
ncbi:hypothetical protein [Vulcanisaeta distributa]|uniref:hypothetical protein n=1 Tax=Vulcanisaeta distributa TaxID=164451 RepID=UPI001FB20679|nr:hypothetical protein [Vulcanisaeta distributa]